MHWLFDTSTSATLVLGAYHYLGGNPEIYDGGHSKQYDRKLTALVAEV